MQDPSANPIELQLITLLGDTFARVQATHAREEYALSQIVSSLKFVNHTVDTWANSSHEDDEPSQCHVYESNLSSVSKSIDAVLGEARLVRESSKRTSATPKGATSTSDNAVAHIPRKTNVAEPKKTLERFSQALHTRPMKSVSADHGECPSLSAAREMLLRWMESRKVGWAEQRPFSMVAKPKHEKCAERSKAARRFLESLWTIHGSQADSERKAEDAAAAAASGGDLIEMASAQDDDPRTTSTPKQVQKNVEELQALCKLLGQRHLHSELLSPHMTTSNAFQLRRCWDQPKQVGSDGEESTANSAEGSWLPASVCWRVLGKQVKGIVLEHEPRAVPALLYSHLQRPLETTRLMHSIQTNIFQCHLQSVLGQCALLRASQSSKRNWVDNSVLSNSSEYTCLRLAHCLACKNGKALFSVARRVEIPEDQKIQNTTNTSNGNQLFMAMWG